MLQNIWSSVLNSVPWLAVPPNDSQPCFLCDFLPQVCCSCRLLRGRRGCCRRIQQSVLYSEPCWLGCGCLSRHKWSGVVVKVIKTIVETEGTEDGNGSSHPVPPM